MAGDTNGVTHVPAEPNLMELLEQQTEETLHGMEERVKKSVAALEELLRDLEMEREDLKSEKEHLDSSINDILHSASCLHISKGNIAGAKLQETSLHKVNRLASKFLFKGKETVQINENMSELRRNPQAVDKDGNQVHPPSILQSRLQNGMQNANRWWSQAHSAAQSAASEAATVASEGAKSMWAQVQEKRTSQAKYSQPVPPRVSMSNPESPSSNQSEDAAVLIELEITLDDERTLLLQVRAADRACWAAEHFLEQHGLDLGLKDALTKYLTQIEDDAECFPIHTATRLSDLTSEPPKQASCE
eukprot:GEMP01011345.1.p1 GENE.GEMP01011345.1~~GEMP01011345.1.p1  ORF type:complete len:304 (+),score=69.83 GEMP01011345.1:160-1071(+)